MISFTGWIHVPNNEKCNEIVRKLSIFGGILLSLAYFLLIIMFFYSYCFDILLNYYECLGKNNILLIEIFLNCDEFTQQNTKNCNKCNLPKPKRAHHCKICGKCIFKMDHHCPWISNCVGHYNHRYFLLMVFYTFISLVYLTICFSPFYLSEKFKVKLLINNKKENCKINQTSFYYFCLLSSGIFSVSLLGFNVWSWFLAFKGHTTIEYLFYSFHNKEKLDQIIYNFGSLRNNLEVIFGTKSYWKMLLPSVRPLIYNGIIWENSLLTNNSQNYLTMNDIENNDNNLHNNSMNVVMDINNEKEIYLG